LPAQVLLLGAHPGVAIYIIVAHISPFIILPFKRGDFRSPFSFNKNSIIKGGYCKLDIDNIFDNDFIGIDDFCWVQKYASHKPSFLRVRKRWQHCKLSNPSVFKKAMIQ
jgi:hypothetical protein